MRHRTDADRFRLAGFALRAAQRPPASALRLLPRCSMASGDGFVQFSQPQLGATGGRTGPSGFGKGLTGLGLAPGKPDASWRAVAEPHVQAPRHARRASKRAATPTEVLQRAGSQSLRPRQAV